ncbi:hypothetical protein BDD12DRAFT_847628 [Trichophaea hybrida]|nr:hypothetical protein BDD12DRAFT_847628 [Trichophaea hybrida]
MVMITITDFLLIIDSARARTIVPRPRNLDARPHPFWLYSSKPLARESSAFSESRFSEGISTRLGEWKTLSRTVPPSGQGLGH